MGFFSSATLGYLVPVFAVGGLRPLTDADVPALPDALCARTAAATFDRAWEYEVKKEKTTQTEAADTNARSSLLYHHDLLLSPPVIHVVVLQTLHLMLNMGLNFLHAVHMGNSHCNVPPNFFLSFFKPTQAQHAHCLVRYKS